MRNWLALTVEYQLVAQEELGLEVRRCLGILYTDYGVVRSRDLDWLQGSLNVLISVFRRCGLVANVENYKSMAYQPGPLRSGMSEEVVGQECTGRGANYCNQLRRRIPCTDCGVEFTAGFMTMYRLRMHGTDPEIDWNQLPVSQTEHLPQVFDVSLLKGTSQ